MTLIKTIISAAMLFSCLRTTAQLPAALVEKLKQSDILAKAPESPKKTQTLSEWPRGTFIENLCYDAASNMLVTSLFEGKIYKIDASGNHTVYATAPQGVFILALWPVGNNEYIVSGADASHKPIVYKLGKDKNFTVLAHMPKGMYLNGFEELSPGKILVANSFGGSIYLVDVKKKAASLWLQSDLFYPADTSHHLPGINGMKLHNGKLYMSNTDKKTLMTVPVINGKSGKPSVWMNDIMVDDFDMDKQGTIYAATALYSTITRITPNRTVTKLTGSTNPINGPTSVHWDRKNPDAILITTNGGVILPSVTGVVGGKVIRMYLK